MIKKIFSVIRNMMIGMLMVFVFIGICSNIQSIKNPEYIPSVMGYSPMTVLTGSMRPTLEPGDLILVDQHIDKYILDVGEIITYRLNDQTLITHRIVKKIEKNEEIFLQTKGDTNNVEDKILVSKDQIVGVFAYRIPKGGYLISFIRNPKGFILLIMLPLLLLLGEDLVKLLSSNKNEDH